MSITAWRVIAKLKQIIQKRIGFINLEDCYDEEHS